MKFFFNDSYPWALKVLGAAAVVWFVVWVSIFYYSAAEGVWAFTRDPSFWLPIALVVPALCALVAFWRNRIKKSARQGGRPLEEQN